MQSGWIENEYQMDIGYHCVEGIVLEIHQDLFGAVGNIFLPYTCGYQEYNNIGFKSERTGYITWQGDQCSHDCPIESP